MNEPTIIEEKEWPLDVARKVGAKIVELLTPYCEPGCVGVAGSVRRGKPEVSDIEILYVSRIGTVKKYAEMVESEAALADMFINRLVGSKFEKRPNKDGVFTWGLMNKLAIHKATKIPVDFFATTYDDWFRTLVIRTGPRELNIRLIQGARERGLKMHAYRSGFTRESTGEVVPCQSEEEVFNLCGVPYIAVEDR